MNSRIDPVVSLLPHRDDPDRFYDELEDRLREEAPEEPVVFYRPNVPEDVAFEPSPTVKANVLSGETTPPEEPDLNALLYRDHGLANENYSLHHLKTDQNWFASVEGPEEFINELQTNRERLIRVFEVLYERITEQKQTQPGQWIPKIRKKVENLKNQGDFFEGIVDFVAENFPVAEVGFYAPSNKHYTLEAEVGFDPEEWVHRKFLPRDQLHPMDLEEQTYLLKYDEETGKENLFLPLKIGPQREGLLVFFGHLPEGGSLTGPDQLLLENLQGLLSLSLAAHRSAFGRQAGYVIDELTSLRTEKYFRERLGQETERGERYGAELSVFILEIDKLDEIEETYGENAQREALRKLAHQIKNSFRLVDVACRFENDQFGVIYPNTPIEGALTAAQRFEKLVENPFLTIGETEIPIAIDGGIASYPEDGETPEEMIKQARLALYEAKQTEEPALISSHELESTDQSSSE